ncbi:MAG: TonB-dependent receptor, partial [Acidobacteriota bacterium]|nr:TonB-dependent receptor [Acidobacteriota bacterium]
NAQTDTDGTSRVGGPDNPFLDANGYPFADTMTNYFRYSEQTSHEVRLASSFAGNFQFVLGGFQRDGDEPYDARFFNFANPAFNTNTLATCQASLPFFGLPLLSDHGTTSAISGQGGVWACPGELLDWSNAGAIGAFSDGNMNGHWLDFYGHSRFETLAYYGNVEYQVGDRWTLFGGIRHDQDIKTHVQNDVRIGINFGFAVDLWIFRNASVEGFEGKNDAEWNQTTWNAGFQYSANPASMWYGRASKGGRPGGFVGFGNMNEVTFDSEELINYEGGWKGLLADNRLQLEASVFYNDYQGYWVNSERLLPVERRVPGQSAFEGEMNTIDGSWISGLELNAAFRATDRFTIRGWYNYLDSAMGDFETTYCCDPDAPTVEVEFQDRLGNTFTEEVASLTNFGGNRMPLQPRHKFSLTAIYDLANLRFLATLGHTTEKHTDVSNLPKYKIPEYTRLDLRAIWFTPREGLQIHAFAKNILDEIAVQQWRPNEGYGFGSGVIRGSLTDQREVGVMASFRLGGRKTLYGLGGGMGPSAGGK